MKLIRNNYVILMEQKFYEYLTLIDKLTDRSSCEYRLYIVF